MKNSVMTYMGNHQKEIWLVNERVSNIIKDLDSTDARIAKAIQIATGNSYNITQVSSITQGKKTANDVFLSYFLRALPFVNAKHLLFGEGNMYDRKLTEEELIFFRKKYSVTSKHDASVDKDLCDRVRQIRKQLGKTQEEFAESVDVARAMIAAIETYRQNPVNGLKRVLRKIFNVNYNWLMDGEGEMFESTKK
tara:strand:+ start:207 stop:788 length:582 start_codon:yes stop_codon:yes gene_type:complete